MYVLIVNIKQFILQAMAVIVKDQLRSSLIKMSSTKIPNEFWSNIK